MNFFCKHFGHKFEARFHSEESQGEFPKDLWTPALAFSKDIAEIIQSTKSKKETYIHDICVRCGQIVNKNKEKK